MIAAHAHHVQVMLLFSIISVGMLSPSLQIDLLNWKITEYYQPCYFHEIIQKTNWDKLCELASSCCHTRFLFASRLMRPTCGTAFGLSRPQARQVGTF
jgi:hypothetical protein